MRERVGSSMNTGLLPGTHLPLRSLIPGITRSVLTTLLSASGSKEVLR
jgi:hypothetical protein